MFLSFVDRVVIPVVIITLIVGGISGIVFGCALLFWSDAALRFMARMDRWVSTRRFFRPLDRTHYVETPAGPGGRRPVLGSFLVVFGAAAVFFLLTRLDFSRAPYAPTINVLRYLFSGIALEATKWILVVGSAFACVIGVLMLFAPARYLALEERLNHWYSTRHVLPPPGSETMRMALEPQVQAHPRAAGLAIVIASLGITLAMGGLLIARLH